MSVTASDLDFPCFQTSDAMGKPSLPNLSSTDENPYENTPFDRNHVSIPPPPQWATDPTGATRTPATRLGWEATELTPYPPASVQVLLELHDRAERLVTQCPVGL